MIVTALTEMFGLQHPIVLGPMGSVSGGHLAAAVSNAGGLGLVGGGYGDPRPYAPAIKSAGCKLICQVQDVEQARVARDAGADLIVAEGTEAGGHSGARATLPLVPAGGDAVTPIPAGAAGGLAAGRGPGGAPGLGGAGA